MKVSRFVPTLLAAGVALAACDRPSTMQNLETASAARADSLFALRNELLEHVMEGSHFVNEINKELVKARSIDLGAPRQLQPGAELADANEERKAIVTRITRLVERLDAVQGRVAGLRREVADKDSALTTKIAEYERTMAEANQAAEHQRQQFQLVIDAQATRIASLSQRVDTLTGELGKLTSEHNAVYVAVGTREELVEKGVLVPEGRKRFLVAGPRSVAPSRDLDPGAFTRLDRIADRTIVLPEGEYRILTRQNGAHVTTQYTRNGRVTGGITIEEPEQFWNGSRFLILVKS